MTKKKLDNQPAKTPVILVVDDNRENLELLEAYLEDIDCRTIAAYDGPEALEIIKKDKPDLILLDIMMPKMSGFEVCRRVKNDPATTHIPIIMVTALNDFGDMQRVSIAAPMISSPSPSTSSKCSPASKQCSNSST
jgi:CheY-like chemotaxis protein